MYTNSKETIICPKCGFLKVPAVNSMHYYSCSYCGWSSLENTIDISYSDSLSTTLSNLFPHNFNFRLKSGRFRESIKCTSMESLLQSFKVKDPSIQEYICSNYSGYVAYKLRLSLPDWRKDGLLYWYGNSFKRDSLEYANLLTEAYDSLFYGNIFFREIVLPKFKGYYLIHSIGCEDISQTVLTESEYLAQLRRLMLRI